MAGRKDRKGRPGLIRSFIYRIKEKGKSDPARIRRDDELFQRMERIIAARGLYRRKNLSLAILVREVGTNRTYISAALARKGLNFASYIGSFRVQRVLQLLADPACSNMDAGEIAELCGFMSDRTMNYYLNATLGLSFSTIRRRTALMMDNNNPIK